MTRLLVPSSPFPLRTPVGALTVAFLVAAMLLLVTSCVPEEAADRAATERPLAERLAQARLVELTHSLNDETIVWPTSGPFEFEILSHGWTDGGYYYSARNFAGPEHGGTHLDAPIHFAEGRWTTDEIPLSRLLGPATVVDVSERAAADPNYQVTAEDLQAWEGVHGPIPDGAFLLLFTDRSRYWNDAEAYMGTAQRGEAGVTELEFPGLHPDAAQWLVDNRSISAVGLDTPSIDHGPSTEFLSHRILFEENIFAVENVTNLEELPAIGGVIIALPIFLEEGTGGPIRIVALVE
ncbi:MAG: cyclase family protein [Gemmatimonadota bacterium]